MTSFNLTDYCATYASAFYKERVGVALSGGGDSLALCLALKEAGVPFTALHFNHALRPEADKEEAWLRETCAVLNIPFHSRTWQSHPTEGSLHQHARQARYHFFADAACELELKHILLAHTADDVAETALMRLFYGSGLQGLAKMAKCTRRGSYTLHRPLLEVKRSDLRTFLKERNFPWLEDPSNYKTDYVRVRARHWLGKLPPDLAINLAKLSENCAALENALQSRLADHQDLLVEKGAEWAVLNSAVLELPDYAKDRLFKQVFKTLKPKRHAPRTHKQERLLRHLETGQTPYSVGEITFHRKGQQIIARPES